MWVAKAERSWCVGDILRNPNGEECKIIPRPAAEGRADPSDPIELTSMTGCRSGYPTSIA